MKYSYSLAALLAIGGSVIAGPIERRAGAPINAGALNLIETVEGFTSNFVNVNGHPTIGK